MDYYNNIKDKLIKEEIFSSAKDYSKERHKVVTYYEIGKILSDAGKHYGENVIGKYSKKLMVEVSKKYNERTLRRMRQLYLLFEKQKWSPLATKLSWSHYSELLSIKDDAKLLYYVDISIKRNLSKNRLRDIIKSKEYERLPLDTKKKLKSKENVVINELVPDPIIIKGNNQNIYELYR